MHKYSLFYLLYHLLGYKIIRISLHLKLLNNYYHFYSCKFAVWKLVFTYIGKKVETINEQSKSSGKGGKKIQGESFNWQQRIQTRYGYTRRNSRNGWTRNKISFAWETAEISNFRRNNMSQGKLWPRVIIEL